MGREAHGGGSQDAKPDAEALALDTAPALPAVDSFCKPHQARTEKPCATGP